MAFGQGTRWDIPPEEEEVFGTPLISGAPKPVPLGTLNPDGSGTTGPLDRGMTDGSFGGLTDGSGLTGGGLTPAPAPTVPNLFTPPPGGALTGDGGTPRATTPGPFTLPSGGTLANNSNGITEWYDDLGERNFNYTDTGGAVDWNTPTRTQGVPDEPFRVQGPPGWTGVAPSPPAPPGSYVEPPATTPAVDPVDPMAGRNAAAERARLSARDFFSGKNLDPSRYDTSIEGRIARTLAGIPGDATEFDPYFAGLGQNVYTELEGAQRQRSGGDINAMFGPGFETSRLGWTADDPYIDEIAEADRAPADELIRNMLARGTTTQSGYDRAFADINRQEQMARSRLTGIGTGLISGQHQGLRDVAGRGRTGAQARTLDDSFDPGHFGAEADNLVDTFLASLGGGIRAGIGEQPLYSTGGLARLAGTSGQVGTEGGGSVGNPSNLTPEEELERRRQDFTRGQLF